MIDSPLIYEPQITLVGMAFGEDTKWLTTLQRARRKFPWFTTGGNVLFLDSINMSRVATLAPDFLSWDLYEIDCIDEAFVMRHLHSYIHTSHLMIFQADGYPVNPAAWSSDFLEVDYIGAKWWYNDDCNVGNSGFSMRSKRLMEILPNHSEVTHPEDEVICRRLGPMLRSQYGIKFANDALADRFSVEHSGPYSGQFGFHGQWQIPRVNQWLQVQGLPGDHFGYDKER